MLKVKEKMRMSVLLETWHLVLEVPYLVAISKRDAAGKKLVSHPSVGTSKSAL